MYTSALLISVGDRTAPGEIRVQVDLIAETITFTDNGVGMTETKEYLLTIGHSAMDVFRQDKEARE